MFEPSGTTLHVLASIHIPGGKHRDALLGLADTDHNGKLSDRERSDLEIHLAARALFGLKFFVGTSSVALEGAESKLRIPDDTSAPIDLLVHGTTSLPRTAASLRLTTKKTGDPLEMRAIRGDRAVTETNIGKIVEGGFTITLGPLDDVRWKIAGERL